MPLSTWDFPNGSSSKYSKESTRSVGDTGSIHGRRKSSGGGNGNTFQYSCLGDLLDRRSWWAQSLGSQRVGHNLATEHKPGIALCFKYLNSDCTYVLYLVMKLIVSLFFFLQKSINGLIICYISGNCSVTHCVQLFATSCTAAHQGSLSLTISCQNLPKFMSNALDAIQPSLLLMSSSPPTLNLSQPQGFFQ